MTPRWEAETRGQWKGAGGCAASGAALSERGPHHISLAIRQVATHVRVTSDPIARLTAALEGRYGIERELGEGGMATVYLADDPRFRKATEVGCTEASEWPIRGP